MGACGGWKRLPNLLNQPFSLRLTRLWLGGASSLFRAAALENGSLWLVREKG